MDLVDKLRSISNRIPKLADRLQTEEATKMALIVPFLSALGWDVYDPFEVVPEFTADVGTKKGEKVDYAIMADQQPIILLEAKKIGVNLDNNPASQLYRYFSVTKARIGILTDGVIYKFYSDLDEPNKMDQRPFFEFDMGRFDEASVPELKRFTKEGFSVEGTISAAVELKYTRGIKTFLSKEAMAPSEEMVRFLAGQVYDGRMTQAVKEQFSGIVHRALAGWVNDAVARRLQTALGDDEGAVSSKETPSLAKEELPEGVVAVDGDIITTVEEVDAFRIIKAIVAGSMAVDRVHMRDSKSYCSILVDNNNRKPLCRLRFNSKKQKYLGVFDEDKNETRLPIDNIEGIYAHSEAIRLTASRYL